MSTPRKCFSQNKYSIISRPFSRKEKFSANVCSVQTMADKVQEPCNTCIDVSAQKSLADLRSKIVSNLRYNHGESNLSTNISVIITNRPISNTIDLNFVLVILLKSNHVPSIILLMPRKNEHILFLLFFCQIPCLWHQKLTKLLYLLLQAK